MHARGSVTPIALIFNGLLFQSAWLGNVMDVALLPLLITLVVVIAHLLMVRHFFGSAAAWREGVWGVLVTVVGFLMEYLFLHFGVLQHAPQTGSLYGVPVWLLLLWLVFATTFRFSLSFLRHRIAWSAVLGAGAVLSYWGGAALNTSSQLGTPVWIALLWIALSWALLLPVLLMIHRRYIA
jgi:hypothetical protein